jgi:hypothetical protein
MEKTAMKKAFLVTAVFLELFYSQTGYGSSLMADVSTPANLAQPVPAGENEIGAALNDGIQIDFSHAPEQSELLIESGGRVEEGGIANESWALYGSDRSSAVTGNSPIDGAPGEALPSGPGSKADLKGDYTLRVSDSGACNPDAVLSTAAVNGLTPASTPEPGTLLVAGSVLIAIGTTLKKMRKKV